MAKKVFLDANVLRSKTLCDWLFLLRNESQGSLFTYASTHDVISEVLYTIRRDRPSISGAHIAARRSLLAANLDEIIEDFQVLPRHQVGDIDDSHVRAAVEYGHMDYLVTDDRALLAEENFAWPSAPEAISADAFLILIGDLAPGLVPIVTRRQVDYWATRTEQVDLPGRLTAAGCPQFANSVRRHLYEDDVLRQFARASDEWETSGDGNGWESSAGDGL